MFKIKDVFTNVKSYFFKKNDLLKNLNSLFSIKKNRKIDDEILNELKKNLLESDVGYAASKEIIDKLSKKKTSEETFHLDTFKLLLAEIIEKIINQNDQHYLSVNNDLTVFVVCGVNGNGKTTTIAKLANKYKKMGKKIVLGACDTFRAAAQEQLLEWSKKIGIECIVGDKLGSDPASVSYKAVNYAIANKADLLIIDTAGRLQTHFNLMSELKKIIAVLEKNIKKNIDEIIICVEAITGQNALSQIEHFSNIVNITSVIITKIDSTSKPGIVVAIAYKFKNIKFAYLGCGEKIDDLREFSAKEFSKNLVGVN